MVQGVETTQKRTILVVEDSEDNRVLATKWLQMAGYETADVSDGADALAYLRSHAAPDAILLDLRMPNVDGWQFLSEQQRDACIARIPVVIFSCEHHLRGERGLTPNVVCCVNKTDGGERLVRAIRLALGVGIDA